MLSEEQVALLRKYYQTVTLTGEQKERLIQHYWDATKEERVDIVKAYAHIFARDAEFVQRLMLHHDLRKQQQGGGGTSHSSSSTSPVPEGSPTSPQGSNAFSPVSSFSSPTTARLTHSQILLRTAIQDQFQKLSGNGPFPISFGVVVSETERREAIDLYASQFVNPDPPELHRLVQLPQSISTRTRRRINGNYTFYIRCHSTGEMVCAVTITAHHHQTHHFVEMPLFATAAGYKKNGFGRLLNAALAKWCVTAGFEFIMISADVQAIPFWKHLGYEMMSRQERNGIAFFYEHECYKFKGAEPMIGYCVPQRRWAVRAKSECIPLWEQCVEVVLSRMSRVVMTGSLELPSV